MGLAAGVGGDYALRTSLFLEGMNPWPVLSRACVLNPWGAWVVWLISGWVTAALMAEQPSRRTGFLRLEATQTGVTFSNTVPAARHPPTNCCSTGRG